jgi:DNA-binding NarL/FixJ family response regulator
MSDLFLPLEHEPIALHRATYLKRLLDELAEHTLKGAQEVCYALKLEGWTTGAISDELGVSERMVKRLISGYAGKNGVRNPLKRMDGFATEIDITTLVNRAAAHHQESEQTTHPTV